jgi:hypothetical protein
MPIDHTPSPDDMGPGGPGLTDAFRAATVPDGTPLDPQEIIRRSKRRRLPRRAGTGVLLSLAVVGIGVAGFSGIGGGQLTGTTMSDSADRSTSADESTAESAESGADPTDEITHGTPGGDMSQTAPVEKLNLCGGPLAEMAPSPSGLSISVAFPDAAVGTAPVEGTATLSNGGSETITGYTAASPAITLSKDGTVVWHSNGPMIMLAVDVNLAPGESMTYPVTFTPVVCGIEDDSAESFRDDLPAAPAGEYQVSAAIAVMGETTVDTVVGPTSPVTLR